jgi:hypothetical protein
MALNTASSPSRLEGLVDCTRAARWWSLARLLCLAVVCPDASAAPDCTGSWLNAHSTVLRVVPESATVNRLASGGRPGRPLQRADTLCNGDVLRFPTESLNAIVEVYRGGAIEVLDSRVSGVSLGTASPAALEAASRFVNSLLAGIQSFSPPTVPVHAVRHDGQGDQLRGPALLVASAAGEQLLAEGQQLTLTWLSGVPPYRCELLDDAGNVLRAAPGVQERRCQLMLPEPGTRVRAVVSDGAQRSVGWLIRIVPVTSVDRPEWVAASHAFEHSTTDAAWAVWLWRHGGAKWRLQSLSMASTLSASSFLASHFVRSVEADVPVVVPHGMR